MRIAQILFSQGMGSRRECAALLARGAVVVQGRTVHDPDEDFPTDDLVFEVDGHPWPFHDTAIILLHKPAGYECSRQPVHHPSVLDLLPSPLRQRGVQPVGRLDEDTSGVLLLTDDGPLLHRLTSPRHHVEKVYEVTVRHPVTGLQAAALRQGVVLRDDPVPAMATACEVTGERSLRLTLTQGRYHQVKRMVAAAGNRVEALHRSAFGGVTLPGDLAPGGWDWRTTADIATLPAPARGG